MPAPSSARSAASAACRGGGCSATSGRTAAVLDRDRRTRHRSGLAVSPSRWSSRASRPRSSPAATRAGLDRLVVGLLVLFLAQSVGSFLQTYLLGVVGERVVAQMRGDLFGRLVTLSLDFHGANRVGELVSRLSSDVTLVRTMLTQTYESCCRRSSASSARSSSCSRSARRSCSSRCCWRRRCIVVAVVFGRPLQRVSTQVQDTIAHSTATAEEALSGIRVVKSYVREDWELERYDEDLRRSSRRARDWRCGGPRSGR